MGWIIRVVGSPESFNFQMSISQHDWQRGSAGYRNNFTARSSGAILEKFIAILYHIQRGNIPNMSYHLNGHFQSLDHEIRGSKLYEFSFE